MTDRSYLYAASAREAKKVHRKRILKNRLLKLPDSISVAGQNKFAKILKRHKERESKIEDKVVQYVKKHLGGKARKMDGFGFNEWPDRMILLPKCPVLFIEFKRPGKKATEAQANLHKELRDMGFQVWVEDDSKICISKLNAWFVKRGIL